MSLVGAQLYRGTGSGSTTNALGGPVLDGGGATILGRKREDCWPSTTASIDYIGPRVSWGLSGTGSRSFDAEGSWIRETNTTAAGFVVGTFTRGDQLPYFGTRLRHQAVTGQQVQCGYYSAFNTAGDETQINVSMALWHFNPSSGTSTTNWLCVTSDGAGGAPTVVDSGVAAVAATVMTFEVAYNASGEVEFWSDGVLIHTATSNLPNTTAILTAAIRCLSVGSTYVETSQTIIATN